MGDTSIGNPKNVTWWSYIVWGIIIILGLVLIKNFIDQKKFENSIKQEAKDVNYCRSVAAQYGQQGTQAFSNAYYSCMSGKGW